MEVILLENIVRLGKLGDKVTVKPGFGRNYLLPKGKALPVTKENIAKFEARRAKLERQAQEMLIAAQKQAKRIEQLSVNITRQASDEGKLYGSVSARDIAKIITDHGVVLTKHQIILSKGGIDYIGDYPVNIRLHSEVEVCLTIKVVAKKSS